MRSPLIDCFQSKTTIDIMTFIQPINSNARLNFPHSYKEISSVVWLALRYAVKFLPGRKSIFPYAACLWVTLIQQITNNICTSEMGRHFLKESNVSVFSICHPALHFGLRGVFLHDHPATTVPLVLGSFLTQKALSFGCIPLIRVSHFNASCCAHWAKPLWLFPEYQMSRVWFHIMECH